MQNSGGGQKFFSVFSWGTKIFCLIFMGYEIFLGILEFHSAPVPGIKTDRSLIALWKGAAKGSSKDPSTYRGLQVGSSLCKIMFIIILDRLKDNKQLLDQQQGFRRGRGTADGIYVTKRLQQISEKMQKPVFLLFVDLSAAFDHVIRK